MKNSKIKEVLKVSGMKQWELAELLNIGESTLSRRFRKELSDTEQAGIIELIRAQHKGGE